MWQRSGTREAEQCPSPTSPGAFQCGTNHLCAVPWPPLSRKLENGGQVPTVGSAQWATDTAAARLGCGSAGLPAGHSRPGSDPLGCQRRPASSSRAGGYSGQGPLLSLQQAIRPCSQGQPRSRRGGSRETSGGPGSGPRRGQPSTPVGPCKPPLSTAAPQGAADQLRWGAWQRRSVISQSATSTTDTGRPRPLDLRGRREGGGQGLAPSTGHVSVQMLEGEEVLLLDSLACGPRVHWSPFLFYVFVFFFYL